MNNCAATRIESLEQEVVKLRRMLHQLLLGFGLVLSVVVFAGAAAAVSQDFDTLTAKTILLKDAKGRDRIKLATDEQTNPRVSILDDKGVEIGFFGQGTETIVSLHLQREGGDRPSVYLSSTSKNAGLTAASGGGNTAINITASKQGHRIAVHDEVNRLPIAEMSVNGETAAISLKDKNGDSVLSGNAQ